MTLSILKGILILLALVIFLLCGIILHLLVTFVRPNLRWRIFPYLIRIFAASLRKILSVEVTIDGDVRQVGEGGVVIVSNHMSYLDGIILGSIFPVVYVSKKDIKRWFLIGLMSSISGTVFIDRKRKDKSLEYIKEISAKLKTRVNVLLFPEGTSTNGENILPFQTVFFAAPLELRCPILPITIYYTKINNEVVTNDNKNKIHWYGQIPFAAHFAQMIKLKNIEAVVKINNKIDTLRFDNDSIGRKKLAEFTRGVISGSYPHFAEG